MSIFSTETVQLIGIVYESIQMRRNSPHSILRQLGVDQRIENDAKLEKLENFSRCVILLVTGNIANPSKPKCSVLSQLAQIKIV